MKPFEAAPDSVKGKKRYALVAVIMISLSILTVNSLLNQPSNSQTTGFKAAIIDPLSETFPNSSFINNAKADLIHAGYSVDYYGPNLVTVPFFKSLSSKGYSLVIIRAHSTGWTPNRGNFTTIFTGERYWSFAHPSEQLTDLVGVARLDDGEEFFTIHPKFVREAMQGQFHNTIIVMMGCTGLATSEMAQAFVARGAKVYVSWNGAVTPERTDTAGLSMIESLTQGQTVSSAVTNAMDRVGPDSIYRSQLGFYPTDQGQVMLIGS